MKTFEIRVEIGGPSPAFAFSCRNFLVAIHDELTKSHRGTCHGEVSDSLLIAHVRAVEREAFMRLVNAWVTAISRRCPVLKLTVTESPKSVLTREQEELAESNNAIPKKLTRRFFLNLAAGEFVASNVWHGRRESFTCCAAADPETRLEQWKNAVACGAAQRLCRVFRSEEHFQRWSSEMRRYFGLRPV